MAEILSGEGAENKDVFDVIVPSEGDRGIAFGLSIKSKELSRKTAIDDLGTTGRVYMELCNSPAKLWEPLKRRGITEGDFSGQRHAAQIGENLLQTVRSWHFEAKDRFDSLGTRRLDLAQSVYLVISYSSPKLGKIPQYWYNGAKETNQLDVAREYQIHAFGLEYPQGIRWQYASDRCLRGYDPEHPDEAIFDWYALSGGQLKYYPRASASKFASPKFRLARPRGVTLAEKCCRYWPKEWVAARGPVPLSAQSLASEFEAYAGLFRDEQVRNAMLKAASELRELAKANS